MAAQSKEGAKARKARCVFPPTSLKHHSFQKTYPIDTQVELTAYPAAGYIFRRWEVDLVGTENPKSVTVSTNVTVRAVFEPSTYTLTTSKLPTNTTGTVSPAGQTTHPNGSQVTITAADSSTQYFSYWTGDLTGSANPGVLTMNSNKAVTGVFSPFLTLTVNVQGSGSVTKSPNAAGYKLNQIVDLTAYPGSGYYLSHWTGAATGAANPYPVTMTASKSITAVFAAGAPYVSDVIINEVFADHSQTMGEDWPFALQCVPWVELYNRGTSTVDLTGWALTSDAPNPAQWVFPQKTIAPGEYLVVITGGNGMKYGDSFLSAAINITTHGNYLALYNDASPPRIASQFAPKYPEIPRDWSYSYFGASGYLLTNNPTPQAANVQGSALGVIQVNPAAISFGNVPVN